MKNTVLAALLYSLFGGALLLSYGVGLKVKEGFIRHECDLREVVILNGVPFDCQQQD